jgi:hypothetical protein
MVVIARRTFAAVILKGAPGELRPLRNPEPMIRTEAKLLLPAAHVITAKHTCPARHIVLAYPGFPSKIQSRIKSGVSNFRYGRSLER